MPHNHHFRPLISRRHVLRVPSFARFVQPTPVGIDPLPENIASWRTPPTALVDDLALNDPLILVLVRLPLAPLPLSCTLTLALLALLEHFTLPGDLADAVLTFTPDLLGQLH